MGTKIGITNCAGTFEDALGGFGLGFKVLKAGLVNLQRLSGEDLALLSARLSAETVTGDERVSSCDRGEGFSMELIKPSDGIRLRFRLA